MRGFQAYPLNLKFRWKGKCTWKQIESETTLYLLETTEKHLQQSCFMRLENQAQNHCWILSDFQQFSSPFNGQFGKVHILYELFVDFYILENFNLSRHTLKILPYFTNVKNIRDHIGWLYTGETRAREVNFLEEV